MAFVGIVDDRHGMLPDGVPDSVDPGDEDEPAGNALSLDRHHRANLRRCLTGHRMIEQ